MRDLVTAADVKRWLEAKEKTVCVAAGTIITPAARDAARDYGIEIIEGAAVPKETVCKQTAGPEPKAIDQAVIAKIVEEVIAAMGLHRPGSCEDDPCGFKLARAYSLRDADGNGKDGVKHFFAGKDNCQLPAGLIAPGDAFLVREVKSGEVHYVLAGTVKYLINGREYTGRPGDAAFLPAGAKVSVTGTGATKIFFAACPEK